jgi:recombination protein RecR
MLTEEDPCPVCDDPSRDSALLCVVEDAADVLVIERTREFRGRYHVLGGALSPLKGVGPDDIDIQGLLARVDEGVREVVVATDPNVEGEATALYLARLLKARPVSVTRIAFGLPVGGDLEYADEVTMARSLANRREI